MVLSATAPPVNTPAQPRSVSEYQRLEFHAMGSPCEIVFRAASTAQARAYRRWVREWLASFESRYSFFRPDSFVGRVNRLAGKEAVQLDAEGAELVSLCNWFNWTTDGVFDPTAGPLLRLWDYHAPRSQLPSKDELAAARERVGWNRVEWDGSRLRLPEEGMVLDWGGIGKEYAVDKVLAMALEHGLHDVLVNFGHDLRVHGQAPQGGPWTIGLEDPQRPGQCPRGVGLRDGSVCSSGNYLRFMEIEGERFGHIIDTRTGYPVKNGCLSATVVAPTCTEAGILSTAIFILGEDAGMALLHRRFGVEGSLQTKEKIIETQGFRQHLVGRSNTSRA